MDGWMRKAFLKTAELVFSLSRALLLLPFHVHTTYILLLDIDVIRTQKNSTTS